MIRPPRGRGFDAGKYRPRPVPYQGPDGKVRNEKRSFMPNIYMIDTNGNERQISLSNGSGLPPTQAGITKVSRLEASGAFRVNECPLSRNDMIRFVDADLQDTPCKVGDWGRRQPCRHVLEMQARRREAHRKREERSARRHKGRDMDLEISQAAKQLVLGELKSKAEALQARPSSNDGKRK